MAKWIFLGTLLAFQLAAARPVSEKHAAEMARELALFKNDVRDVLKLNCVKCHGGDKTLAKFDLNNPAALLEKHRVVPGSVDHDRTLGSDAGPVQ